MTSGEYGGLGQNRSYTVKQFRSGFQFNMISSTNGTYTINVLEGGRTQTKRVDGFSSQITSHEVQHLKPCTEYEHNVILVDGAGKETICNITGNKKMRTNDIRRNEIEVDPCRPGYVCYRVTSDWDISSSIFSSNNVSAERCNSDNKPCIKLSDTDFCSDLTTTFKSGNCSINVIHNITVDFFIPNENHQHFSNKLPVEIKPTLPSNCKNLSFDYICLDINLSESKTLSELEPFTDYSCTGQIKQNNVNIKNTTTFQFRVDCDLSIEINSNQTDTSIDLSWTTNSQNCPDVPKLQKLSYDCKCGSTESKQKLIPDNKHPSAGTCRFTNLKPFTEYTCEVQPTYNNKEVSNVKTETVDTEIGTPENVIYLEAKVHDQNTITVTCEHRGKLNGPEGNRLYTAQLYYKGDNSELKKITKSKCHFEFKDLSYLTSYTLKVKVSNGRFESSPWIEHVDTQYNKTAVIVLVSLIIIIIPAAVMLVYVSKIYKKCKQSRE
ncbi:receptor-type tyrosine-protein phosphatase C-like [Anabas testudineus]|uniref:receptor-type tyrosine-protein phosphatase C-like n=1 Tax=Anabas testudineus TaxID=64144 RepID=UPI000E459DEB|nr:receptor-type tyrosine-protein phosphatase C-like [Anabas testudineus]